MVKQQSRRLNTALWHSMVAQTPMMCILVALVAGCERPVTFSVVNAGSASSRIPVKAILAPIDCSRCNGLNQGLMTYPPHFNALLGNFLVARGTFPAVFSQPWVAAPTQPCVNLCMQLKEFTYECDNAVILALALPPYLGLWGVPAKYYLRIQTVTELRDPTGKVIASTTYDSGKQEKLYNIYERGQKTSCDISAMLCDAFRAFAEDVEAKASDVLAASTKGVTSGQAAPGDLAQLGAARSQAADEARRRQEAEAAAKEERAKREGLENQIAALKAKGDEAKTERDILEKELADLKTKAERDARDAAAAATKQPSPPAPAHRWGVIIGLAQYQHSGKWRLENLRYADNDATGLAEYLKSPQGGDFDNVELLTNAQATAANIRIAIREHLRSVLENDLVLIFWAGHGCPDPHEPQKLYLITHDTDPAHMAATAYGMDEFRRDVANLRASRVMVIADACHSAGISDPTLGIRGPGDNKIVDDLRGIGVVPKADDPAAPMRMIFTSCEAGEVSRESSELGGGHGVFSYYLLRSLEGEADKKENGGDGDGKVTVGEAIEFTRDQVRRFTGNQQHPATAGRFDRGLSMRPAKE